MKKGNGKDSFNNDTYKILDNYFQIQFQAWKELAEMQMDFNQKCVSACMQQLSIPNYAKDLFTVDSGMTQEYYRNLSENTRQVMEKLFKVECELLECFKNSGDLYKDMPLLMPAVTGQEKPAKQTESISAQA
ncbi:MAG TPA: hypothetical protein VIH22_07285 [Cyclobacteriaceae bacterium]|nr:MAG: hypothetical protein A2993_07285 [Gammaproteobacteria bacterium RIFCSPLOWO2_01_FULL_47_190]OGT74578.1 MAG: hypothetical protein A2W76_09895 [Gammaproteobacteria bacterium RIFCSPLOWO2_12_47_11]OGT84666.1 MAG: hypothetical protein A3G42_04645 [Gammaproteobacteria bacterium RIFCSPLOWO2_12_FULL_47_76]